MSGFIRDGKGRGYLVEINSDQMMEVNAKTETTYAWVSRIENKAFVASSLEITGSGSTKDVFSLENPSAQFNVVIVQFDFTCDEDALLTIEMDKEYSSGGSGINTVNLHRGTGIPSIVTSDYCFYGNDLTLTGTGEAYSTFYTAAKVLFREEFQDALILGYTDTISVSLNASATASAYLSFKYYEVEREKLSGN